MTIYATTLLAESERELRRRIPGTCALCCGRDCTDDGERRERFLAADIAFGNIPVPWLREAQRLQWVQLEAVGIESYLRAAGEPWTRQVLITSLRGFFGIPVAETLVAGILAFYRGLSELECLQREHQWALTEVRAKLRTLHGAPVIVLGAGAIGQHVRDLLTAFGASVLTFARSAPIAEIRTIAELDVRLRGADVVVGCLPETPATLQFFNGDRLARLKHGAIFANGGRGSLLDESALIDALRAGRLGGAVLDVTANEPLLPEHPLWTVPNVILTQHTGGGFGNEAHGKVDFFLANLARFQRGETLTNVVDFTRDC